MKAGAAPKCWGDRARTPLPAMHTGGPIGRDADGSECDFNLASAFLSALGDSHTFQTFGEGPGKGEQGLSRILHGALAEHAEALARLNERNAGVYVMVNGGDGRGRRAENVTHVRAYFLDLDGAPLDTVYAAPLPPHAVVETSPGRWHVYWWVESAPLGEFKAIQQALAVRYNGDMKVCDLPRVMRVPGFKHRKGAPFAVRVEVLRDAPRYSHDEFVAAFGLERATAEPQKRARLPLKIPEGERNDTLFNLASSFVRKGYGPARVNQRLQRINADRCVPPLCATEVDKIAASASARGSRGFTALSHLLQDSEEWKTLPPASCAITLAFYRQYNGHNNGKLSLPWEDFKGRHGIRTSRRFYYFLRRAVNAGVLVQVVKARNTRDGCIPALYAIPEKFLAQVSKQNTAPSAESKHLGK